MPLIDYELVIIRKATGDRTVLNRISLVPRVGEEILLNRDSVTPLKVLSVTHDLGFDRVILTVD